MPKKILVISRQRSGSTAVLELLCCHPLIQNFGELLNPVEDPNVPKDGEMIYEYLNKKLSNPPELASLSNEWPSEYCAFKIHHHEKDVQNFKWDYLIRYCNIEAVIVVWREEIVETIVSAEIARATNEWYSMNPSTEIHSVNITADLLETNIDKDIKHWTDVFESWPIEIRPIFIQYEELFNDSNDGTTLAERFQKVFHQIGIEGCDFVECYSKRQNPAPLEQKVKNWSLLPKELRERKINVPAMFTEIINKQFGLPQELVSRVIPDREPIPSPGGFKYRVAEPYIPKEVFNNVNDALNTGNISSASYWPKKLSEMLCTFFKSPVAIPCANGFIALALALQSSNIKENDEVIVPALTMIAVPNAVKFIGANPVFIDVEEGNYNPSWGQIAEAITPNTKAVIVSHTYGSPAKDVEIIAAECKKRKLIFIEDISEAVGISIQTKNGSQLLGTFGDYACASMYVNKMLHAGDGGFILSNNPATHTRLQSILNHGFTRSYHFVHFESCMNGKINGLGAAVACGVLENFQTIIKRRHEIAKWYRKSLAGIATTSTIELMPECGIGDTPWVFGLHCSIKSMRTALRKHLAKFGIETRDYFFPMHLQPAFCKNDHEKLKSLPVSERYGSTGFYLPTHTNLTKATVKWIGKVICDFFDQSFLNNEIDLEEANGRVYDDFGRNNISLNNNLKEHDNDKDNTGKKILRKMQKCFNGEEIWDDKKKILMQFKIYLETPFAKFDSKIETLQSFYDYFKATMDVENVPKDDKTFEEVIQKLMQSVKKDNDGIIYLQKYPNDNDIISSLRQVCKDLRILEKQIPENGYAIKIDSSRSFHIAIVNLTDVTIQEAMKLKSLYKNQKAFAENLILINATEKFLPFLTELTEAFVLERKYNDSIRVFKALSPKINSENVEWDEYQTQWNTPLPRKLKFVGDPDWSHHHQNAYQSAINILKERFHDDNADVLFISAVEQYICDCEIIPKQPWIGIIHGISKNDKRFYVPDLEKLCTKPRFKPWLKNCVGLFTLTSTQQDYLKNNMWPEFKFPINQLYYPSILQMNELQDSSIVKKLAANNLIDIYFIGSFDRNFEHFFNSQFPKNMKKVLLQCDWETPTTDIPKDVQIAERANSDEYERILRESIIFLSLKNGGAANTLVIECIARNLPIVASKMKSVTDYIGDEYPLLFKPEKQNFLDFLTAERIAEAIEYLKNMDKSFLTLDRFVKDFETSSILSYIQPMNEDRMRFDLTISICSYKRTHNLSKILNSLINHQSSKQSYEIIIWNNNNSRKKEVEKIVNSFKRATTTTKKNKVRLELITSSENHVCSVRFAISMLMQSEKLLICDDDVIPGPEYIEFFMKHNSLHPRDVLCVRGNRFLPHIMPTKNVHEIWTNYDAFEFLDDFQDECSIHYVHADACLIPKQALLEVAATYPPDNSFMLVDDYWMSYVLAGKFDRNLRKLKIAENVLIRTPDSEQVGVAMYTRKDVANARTRMYIHHMTNGWPIFEDEIDAFENTEIKDYKLNTWKKQRIGFNINSEISENEIQQLVEMNISLVRIGTAGIGRNEAFEFSQLNTNPKATINEIEELIKKLSNYLIDVIIVLDRRLATEKNWIMIAEQLCHYKNVVGYDLINEPATTENQSQHWYEIRECQKLDDEEYCINHIKLIKAIRSRDNVTPIIIETMFWANIGALKHLNIKKFKGVDDMLIASIHYYLPQTLTWRSQNNGRYTFPGDVPIYENSKHSELIHWSPEYIDKEFEIISQWINNTGIPVFIGEFGITREVHGAELYLTAIADSCKKYNLSACLYAYRDPDWEAMDYELGVNAYNLHERSIGNDNPLYAVIRNFNSTN